MPKTITDKNKINEVLTRGVGRIYPGREALAKVLESGKRIKLYNGIDPTGPTLHLGHLVQLLKLKQFQDLGHEVIVLIGDFTAQIGDPTDKMALRKQLTHERVMKNCREYKEQIGRFLDLGKVQFKYNSSWLEKLNFSDILRLASHFTAQQTLARDMFKKRMQAGKDLFLHEFLYPMMQAYDSVAMDVDLEVGGNDQMFNMLAGRTLMKKIKNREKYVMTTKLLEDPSGRKMGKTEGNMVALNLVPEDMYGRIMSWPDEFIGIGFELCTGISMAEIKSINEQVGGGSVNPRDLKMKLAYEIVKINYGKDAAKEAEERFVRVIQRGEIPQKIKIKKLEAGSVNIVELLVTAGLVGSRGEARRLIQQGGIKVGGKTVSHANRLVEIREGGVLLQRGKRRFIKIITKK